MIRPTDLVVSLRDVEIDDVHHVTDTAIGIQEGFAITSRAYFKFLSENNLETKIRHLLGSINFDHEHSLVQVSTHIKNLIKNSRIPDVVVYKVSGHYADIGASNVRAKVSIISGDPRQNMAVAERVEELKGDAVLLDTLRTLWAHIYDPGYIIYRNNHGLDHLRTGAVVIVQKN